MVVTEAVSVMLDYLEYGKRLGFVTAFAMPTFSEWRPHAQSTGISTEALNEIAKGHTETAFLLTMSRCLSHCRNRGPNAALLASVLTTLRGHGLRIWANDIPNGHYDDAIPSLEKIATLVERILPESRPELSVKVCDRPYPGSLENLKVTLAEWDDVGPLVGFLDPMRYISNLTAGPYTRSVDHRQWLSMMKAKNPFVAIHFTGNSDSASFSVELSGLRADLAALGIANWVEFKRQHYVVSVGCSHAELLDGIQQRTVASWQAWCQHVPEIKHRQLTALRG